MVTQPAYLANLKTYTGQRAWGGENDIADALNDYSSESDRGAIILAATVVEDALGDRIRTLLPGLRTDDSLAKKVFEGDGMLSTFSRKIDMAYAMGIIDKPNRNRIDIIREIRNACAHCRRPLSLKLAVLRVACEHAISEMLPIMINKEPLTIRKAFVVKCMFLSLYILGKERLDDPKAQFRWFQQNFQNDPRST